MSASSGLQQIIQSQKSQLAEKDQTISRKEQNLIIAQNSQILRGRGPEQPNSIYQI